MRNLFTCRLIIELFQVVSSEIHFCYNHGHSGQTTGQTSIWKCNRVITCVED